MPSASQKPSASRDRAPLGALKKRLALLKVDIEGAEYEVLRSMLAAGVRPEQLLVEFDQINQPLSPLFWVELVRVLRELRDAGYRLVHRERSNYVFVLNSALVR